MKEMRGKLLGRTSSFYEPPLNSAPHMFGSCGLLRFMSRVLMALRLVLQQPVFIEESA